MHQLGRLNRIIDLLELTDYVRVEAKKAFPIPAGGIIQLLDNTVYYINGEVNIGTDRLVVGANTLVVGTHNSRDKLVYEGTGAAIQALGGNDLRVEEITIIAATGAYFDAVDAPVVDIGAIKGNSLRVGRFEDCNEVVVSLCTGNNLESGMEMVNSSPGKLLELRTSDLQQQGPASGVILDLGSSVWDTIQLIDTLFVSSGTGVDIRGLAANNNLTPVTGRGRVFGNIVNGLGDHLDNITSDDVQWAFVNNTGIADSVAVGSFQLEGNAAVTTIGTQNVFVKAAGVTTLTMAKRFDGGDPVISNNLRYIGLSPVPVCIQVNAELTKSGALKLFALQVFKNGDPIGVPFHVETSAARSTTEHVSVVAVADTDDEFDLRVANTVDTDDVTITDLVMSVVIV